MELDFTHDPNRRSWVESANDSQTDFPIQNLPFGVFLWNDETRIGVAIGDDVLDLHACASAGLLDADLQHALQQPTLNQFMSRPVEQRRELRHTISRWLSDDTDADREQLQSMLHRQAEITLCPPCHIRDYTDFYASVFHATNIGSMFRPDNPLLPNYKHIPIGYHGRASSIVVSGSDVKRPVGQKAPAEAGGNPTRSPSTMLDYELEVGFFVATGNELGNTIPIEHAESHLFGMCLVNDWSARDLQKWEYQPLGPFLAKSFATTISPWIVTMDALAPFRCPEFSRPAGDPQPLEYLSNSANSQSGGVGIELEVLLSTAEMRKQGMPPQPVSHASFKNMYWTIAQMLTHHSSNGCNMQPGDLLASGTVSGPGRDERGCLMELTWNGDAENPVPGTDRTPIKFPTGEERRFLEDGDQVILKGQCGSPTHRRIGFGQCSGIILPSH